MTVPQLPLAYFGIFAPLAVQIMRQLVDGELMITNNIFDQIADRAFFRSQIGSDEQNWGLHNVPHARVR